MARKARDSFTVTIDGGPVGVTLGSILPEGHLVLRHLDKVAPGNQLFEQLVEDEPAPEPVAKPAGRATKAAR